MIKIIKGNLELYAKGLHLRMFHSESILSIEETYVCKKGVGVGGLVLEKNKCKGV